MQSSRSPSGSKEGDVSKVSRMQLAVVVVVLVAAAAAIVTIITLKGRPRIQIPEQVKTEIDHPEIGVRHMTLHFPTADGTSLAREVRALNLTADKNVQLRSLVEELAHTSLYDRLPCLPKGTKLRNLLVANKGLAYVDLSSEFLLNHPGGLTGEQFSIRCLALTLADNFPEITAVKILVDGAEIETIAGHIDASKPFMIDEIRRASGFR